MLSLSLVALLRLHIDVKGLRILVLFQGYVRTVIIIEASNISHIFCEILGAIGVRWGAWFGET